MVQFCLQISSPNPAAESCVDLAFAGTIRAREYSSFVMNLAPREQLLMVARQEGEEIVRDVYRPIQPFSFSQTFSANPPRHWSSTSLQSLRLGELRFAEQSSPSSGVSDLQWLGENEVYTISPQNLNLAYTNSFRSLRIFHGIAETYRRHYVNVSQGLMQNQGYSSSQSCNLQARQSICSDNPPQQNSMDLSLAPFSTAMSFEGIYRTLSLPSSTRIPLMENFHLNDFESDIFAQYEQEGWNTHITVGRDFYLQNPEMQRFVLAHEVGHHLFHYQGESFFEELRKAIGTALDVSNDCQDYFMKDIPHDIPDDEIFADAIALEYAYRRRISGDPRVDDPAFRLAHAEIVQHLHNEIDKINQQPSDIAIYALRNLLNLLTDSPTLSDPTRNEMITILRNRLSNRILNDWSEYS